jgi:murein DD-endopeptidase MepM/ murein hydrolase activator NlpD
MSSATSFDLRAAELRLGPLHAELKPIDAGVESLHYRVRRNSTFYQALRELGLGPQEIHGIVAAARDHFDLSKIMAGAEFNLLYAKYPLGRLVEIEFDMGPLRSLRVLRNTDNAWVSQFEEIQAELRWVSFTGNVNSSLWNSAQLAGMDPNLISELTSIFAWQVDFAREVQRGDRWRILVEQRHVGERLVGWGSILAAEYHRESGEVFEAYLLRDPEDSQDVGYFSPDGKSLRRMFLKAPLKFGRITSHFSFSRFHPVLKTRRPHLGVDYAAPTGTPILAVGDGVVLQSSWIGGGGNTVRLRHNSTYQTVYRHMHGFAKGIKVGSRVRQGQVIGYVGSTGLSTGPHLHFELWENGKYVDPLGKKFPSADPVPQKHMVYFSKQVMRYSPHLPPLVSSGTEVPKGPLLVSMDSDFNK